MSEKVLAKATTKSGELTATAAHLRWHSEESTEQLAWHEIARAWWNSESGQFLVEPVKGERREWNLVDPGRLPETARERITSTIIAQDQIEVPGVGRVGVIFRNVGGEVATQIIGSDLDPALIADQIAQVRADLGIG